MRQTVTPQPCLDCGRPKGRKKSPRCTRCRARRSREVARIGKRAQRERVWDSTTVPAAPDEPQIASDELTEPEPIAEEQSRPVPSPRAPISHVSPPPAGETRPPVAPPPPDTGRVVPGPIDEVNDAHTNDLTRWIQDRERPLEFRRRVRDELARREPVAEEKWERDAIRWVLATFGSQI